MGYVARVSTLMLVAVWLSSCDSLVYTDGEVQAQRRFGSIISGRTEVSVVTELGAPMGVVKHQASGLVLEESRDGATHAIELAVSDRANWPEPVRFIPDRPVTGKVLIYVDGTVTAFYFIDSTDKVEYASVYTS